MRATIALAIIVVGCCLAANCLAADLKIDNSTIEAGRAVFDGQIDPSHWLVVRIVGGQRPQYWGSGPRGNEFRLAVEASDKLTLEGGGIGSGFTATFQRRSKGEKYTSSGTVYVHLPDGTLAFRRAADFLTKNGVFTFADVILKDGTKLPITLSAELKSPTPPK